MGERGRREETKVFSPRVFSKEGDHFLLGSGRTLTHEVRGASFTL
jgi:hypothetical protein